MRGDLGWLSKRSPRFLGLARVLLHEPQVLLLDEPASGLDPRARIEMRELIKELRKMNKTIMVSSHILPELADICNKIGIIERGKLIWNGTVEAAIQEVRGKAVFTVSVGERNDEAAKKIAAFPEVESVIGKAGRADTPTDPAPLEMFETIVNFRPKALWPKRVLKFNDAAQQSREVLRVLEEDGFVQRASREEDRDALVNDATQKA